MNFVKLFNDYNVEYDTCVNKGWTNVTCPFCDDKTFNGGFNNAGDYYHCWKCGGHNFKQALSRVTSIPMNQMDDLIQQYQGRNSILNRLNKKQAKATRIELPTDGFTTAERQYLLSRNFSPRMLKEKYKVVGGGITGPWKYRIIIPLVLDGKIVSWTARTILSKEKQQELKIPRYKNLSIEQSVIDPKSILYNLDNCTEKTAVLTEGSFDVMRLGDGFMCSFGTELTQSQVAIIKQRFEKVFIMFDNEKEAQEKARKFGLQIAGLGVAVEIVDAYSDFNKKDGGELNEQEVKIIRKELGLKI